MGRANPYESWFDHPSSCTIVNPTSSLQPSRFGEARGVSGRGPVDTSAPSLLRVGTGEGQGMRRIAAWLVLVALWHTGDSFVLAVEQPVSRAGGNAKSLAMTVRILDADRNPLPDGSYAGEVTLYLPFIAGALFGEAEETAAIRKRVRIGDRLRFDLAALRGRVDAAARVWRDAQSSSQVTVSPAETRLVRFGAASTREDGTSFADHTLTLDLDTKETLLLVYTDRPCSIRGSGRAGAATAEYVVDLPAAGFHWVRLQQLGTDRLRLSGDPSVEEATLGLQVIPRGEVDRRTGQP